MFNPWSGFRNLMTIMQLKLVTKKQRRRKKMPQCPLKQRPLFSLRYVVKVCAILFKAFSANFDVGILEIFRKHVNWNDKQCHHLLQCIQVLFGLFKSFKVRVKKLTTPVWITMAKQRQSKVWSLTHSVVWLWIYMQLYQAPIPLWSVAGCFCLPCILTRGDLKMTNKLRITRRHIDSFSSCSSVSIYVKLVDR